MKSFRDYKRKIIESYKNKIADIKKRQKVKSNKIK